MILPKKIFVFVVVMLTLIMSSCSNGSGSLGGGPKPLVTITMENGGVIEVELYPDKAPNTVNNFISLINNKFYDGLTFHRIEPGFVIQGGDPEAKGTGGPGYRIKGEFSDNGFDKNDLKHTAGVISMARQNEPLDSAGSQFFIMLQDNSYLDGKYAAFGKVVKGTDVINKMVEDYQAKSNTDYAKMKTVTVNTYGVSYPEPEKIK